MGYENEPMFPLEEFYTGFKLEEQTSANFTKMLQDPSSHYLSKKYTPQITELRDRIAQHGLSLKDFLSLSMLNVKPFQFKRLTKGLLKYPENSFGNFEWTLKPSHKLKDLVKNPYVIYEDYQYWPHSHDNVYGEEQDAPIDLFKIDIAYFPDSRITPRIELQSQMSFIDKRRIRALILRHLHTLENSGDCFSNAELLQDVIRQYPLYYELGQNYTVPPELFYPLDADYANHFREDPRKLELVEGKRHHVLLSKRSL